MQMISMSWGEQGEARVSSAQLPRKMWWFTRSRSNAQIVGLFSQSRPGFMAKVSKVEGNQSSSWKKCLNRFDLTPVEPSDSGGALSCQFLHENSLVNLMTRCVGWAGNVLYKSKAWLSALGHTPPWIILNRHSICFWIHRHPLDMAVRGYSFSQGGGTRVSLPKKVATTGAVPHGIPASLWRFILG